MIFIRQIDILGGLFAQVSTYFQENINKSKSSEYYPDTSE